MKTVMERWRCKCEHSSGKGAAGTCPAGRRPNEARGCEFRFALAPQLTRQRTAHTEVPW
jgi:hypothetical protein